MWWMDDADEHGEDAGVRHIPLRQMLRRILPLFRPHARTIVARVGAAADLGGGGAGRPLLVRHLLDKDIPAADTAGVLDPRAALRGALRRSAWGRRTSQVVLISRVGLQIVTGLRQQVFEHLLDLSLAYFDKNPPGRLMARVECDVERLQMLFSDVALALFRNVVLFGGTLTVMMVANSRVTLAILALLMPLADRRRTSSCSTSADLAHGAPALRADLDLPDRVRARGSRSCRSSATPRRRSWT